MLKQQEQLEDTKGNSQEDQDEELYQRLFKKIARDFIFVDDLDVFLDSFYDRLLEAQRNNEQLNKEEMKYYSAKSVLKAMEYKNNLSLPKRKRRKYKDVDDG